MAFHGHGSQSVSSYYQESSLGKKPDEPLPSKVAQSTVTCIYQANIGGYWRNVSVLWCKNYMNHTLHLTIDSIGGDCQYHCKIDVKPWHFWSKKGYKSFDVDGHQVEISWDLRAAKFSGSPEPSSDYYIALVSNEEVVLFIGDYKRKAYKRIKSRQALVDAMPLVKKENVFAKKTFSTKARFDEMRKESEVVVESWSSSNGSKEPEMWVSIDGVVLIHVKNLQWKFRGNQTVMVDKQPIQVLWDVHDWLFSSSGSGPGLFIFKPGPVEAESENEAMIKEGCESESDDGNSVNYSAPNNFDFCLLLFAYKLE